MIRVSRLDGKEFVINALLIETVEAVPDTVITLTNGHKYVVRESVDEVIEQVAAFHRRITAGTAPLSGRSAGAPSCAETPA